MIPIKIPIIER
jgi:hypothetical protein